MTVRQFILFHTVDRDRRYARLSVEDTAKVLEEFNEGLNLQITMDDGTMYHYKNESLVCIEVRDGEGQNARGETRPPPEKSRKRAS